MSILIKKKKKVVLRAIRFIWWAATNISLDSVKSLRKECHDRSGKLSLCQRHINVVLILLEKKKIRAYVLER